MVYEKNFTYEDRIKNQNLEEYFGVEEADTYIDGKEEEENLGDYDLTRYDEEE